MNSPFRIEFNTEQDFLSVAAHGKATLDAFGGFLSFIVGVAHDRALKGILVDVRDVIGGWTYEERIQLGIKSAKTGIKIPIACIGMGPMIDPGPQAQAIAHGAGLNISIFIDLSEAKLWLRTQIAETAAHI